MSMTPNYCQFYRVRLPDRYPEAMEKEMHVRRDSAVRVPGQQS